MAATLVACVVVALLAQGAAEASAPKGVGDAADTLGRAGFSYLTGLRKFAAYLLWDHIDPQQHEYYGTAELQDQIYILPTVAIVSALDPSFEEPYYIAPYILARRGLVDQAEQLAEKGVRNLPLDGLIRISYAQILADYARDLPAASKQVDLAVLGDWRNDDERFFGYAVGMSIYRRAGETTKAADLKVAHDAIGSRGATLTPSDADAEAPTREYR